LITSVFLTCGGARRVGRRRRDASRARRPRLEAQRAQQDLELVPAARRVVRF
jgi:hypothetical protein